MRTRRLSADLLPDVVLLAVALASGLGASRLVRQPGAAHVLLPIAACVVAGHVVVSVVRHFRLPDPLPSVIGVLAVALVSIWTLLPAATRVGIPTATTIRVLLHHFADAGTVIRSNPTPVPSTSGVVLCLAAGAGLAAVFARTLWSWQEIRPAGSRRPLVALFPTFGLFCYTALLSSDIDRATGTAIYLAAALVFLAVADRPHPVGGTARVRGLLWRSGTMAALSMAAVAVVVPVIASPSLTGLRLDAIPFSHGNGGTTGASGAAGSGNPSDVAGVGALNLIDNMRAVLTSRSDLVMFTAVSRTPTYWQVATLTRFDGNSWLPDVATKQAAEDHPQLTPDALPGLPVPLTSHTFTAAITIANLRSTLLPVPPDTVSVGDASSIEVESNIGLVGSYANPENLTYEATAGVPPTLSGPQVPSVSALDDAIPPATLQPYLALPTISPDVVQLAHQIVAHAKSPAAQATALVRYFTSEKRFRYTLNPPPVSGTNALSSFLFATRAGFCQQFAGAFAVMARIDGLPTRLAVGFTTGTTEKGDTYSVTGADAHSWPQVYLGPTDGWVSFEPTPASTDEAIPTGVLNGTPTSTPSRLSAVTTTTLSDKRLGQGIHPAAGSKGLGSGPRPGAATPVTHASRGWIVLLALAAVAVIVGATVAGPWLWRRRRPRLRRHRFPRTGPPRAEILARWEQATTVLARTGLGRRPSETIEEHATRLVAQTSAPVRPVPLTFTPRPPASLDPATDAERVLQSYRALAALASRASYAPDPCTKADVAEARRLSDELRAALRHGAPVGAPMGPRP